MLDIREGHNPPPGLTQQHPAVPLGQGNLAANLYLAEGCVAKVYDIDPALFYHKTRGRAPVAEARQVLMYLVHVVFGVSLTEVGRLYNRDRTTASHACTKTEDKRDDPAFDHVVHRLELAMSTAASLPKIQAAKAGQ